MGDHPVEERHASWAELFFDLVVVAGLGLLAHVLHDVTPQSIALFVGLFLAFWLCWTAFMLYGNAVGAGTRTLRLLIGMFGLAVMVAAVPGVADQALHHGDGEAQTTAFVIAYVACRAFAAGGWRRGQVVLDWPIAQQTTGALPWLVSIWVDEPWKYLLWALGLAIDVLVLLFLSSDDLVEHAEQRAEALRSRDRRRGDPERGGRVVEITRVGFDPVHLGERLSLFVIIVLGEGVIQSVTAAARVTWGGGLLGTALGCFVLLAGLWGLGVVYGHAGVPHLRAGWVPRRVELALHAVTCASLVAAAAGLGWVVAHREGPYDDAQRWLLCGSVALWFGLGLVAGFASRRRRPGLALVWAVTGIAVPLALAGFGDSLGPPAVVWYLALVVLAHTAAEQRAVGPAPA